MQDKMKLRDFIEAKEIKPEELDSIAGGVVWNDLTPEEQKRFNELNEIYINCADTPHEDEATKNFWDFVHEMEKKYGE
ncbi:MAG: hypothetical protein J6D07_01830 [Mogibacterium sp.]|nr:hypothetical protein [Mogibacterium sp.]